MYINNIYKYIFRDCVMAGRGGFGRSPDIFLHQGAEHDLLTAYLMEFLVE